jgi:hypothetical protein
MQVNIKVDSKNVEKLLSNLQNTLKQTIEGEILDPKLNASLVELKKQLLLKLETLKLQPKKTKTKATNNLGQEVFDISKIQNDVLKFFTGSKAGYTEYNESKSFSEVIETNILVGHHSKNSMEANRVTLRMNINPEDTAESHYAAAVNYINKAVFILPDTSGKLNYYINPGIDLSDKVKIKCSTQTGINREKPKKGLTPEERFEKDATRKRADSDSPYAEWTLKQEAVDTIRKSFINITSIMDNIKKGDFETAERLAEHLDSKKKTKIQDKLIALKKGALANEPLADYKNVTDFINSLKWVKKKKKNEVRYIIVSKKATLEKDTVKELGLLVKQWCSIEKIQWFRYFIKQFVKLLRKSK